MCVCVCVCVFVRACVCVCVCMCVALLSSSIREFAKIVGTDPEKRKLLQLTGNRDLAEKKVVLMSVPSSTDTLFEKKTRQAIGELLELLQTTAPGSTVAFPMKWNSDMDERKCANTTFHAIVEELAAKSFQRHNIVLKLYFDQGTSAVHGDEFHSMDKHLTKGNWATSGCFSKYVTDFYLFTPVFCNDYGILRSKCCQKGQTESCIFLKVAVRVQNLFHCNTDRIMQIILG